MPVSRSVASGSVDLKRVQSDRLLWQSPRCFTLADRFHGQDKTCTWEILAAIRGILGYRGWEWDGHFRAIPRRFIFPSTCTMFSRSDYNLPHLIPWIYLNINRIFWQFLLSFQRTILSLFKRPAL